MTTATSTGATRLVDVAIPLPLFTTFTYAVEGVTRNPSPSARAWSSRYEVAK